jgi:hypothetical protein
VSRQQKNGRHSPRLNVGERLPSSHVGQRDHEDEAAHEPRHREIGSGVLAINPVSNHQTQREGLDLVPSHEKRGIVEATS